MNRSSKQKTDNHSASDKLAMLSVKMYVPAEVLMAVRVRKVETGREICFWVQDLVLEKLVEEGRLPDLAADL